MKNCLTRGKWATDDDGDGDEGVKVELVPTRAVNAISRTFVDSSKVHVSGSDRDHAEEDGPGQGRPRVLRGLQADGGAGAAADGGIRRVSALQQGGAEVQGDLPRRDARQQILLR